MRGKKLFLILLSLALMTILLSAPVSARGDSSSWERRFDIRIWGFDLVFKRTGSPLFAGVDTGYFLSLGGGLETFGFYREIDHKVYVPPQNGTNLALYKNANITWSLGLNQGLLYDPTRGRNSLEAILFYHGRYDDHCPDRTPQALLFASDLPDRKGGLQNSIFAGLVYNGVDTNSECWSKQGWHAETSLEFAPLSLFNASSGADYTRFNGTLLGFITFLEGRDLSIYLGECLMYDQLCGDYIPVRSRTTLGGYSKYPYFTRGLGGGVRGVEVDRFDGYIKALNNLELRINFPRWSEYGVVPELIFYFDAGVYDNLSHKLDWDNLLTSAGIGVGVSDLLVYGSYFFNERRFSFELALGVHF